MLQVKNALDPAACQHETGGPAMLLRGARSGVLRAGMGAAGGFRFVKLLVRLGTPQAKELGLDGHVCEVLLVLTQLEQVRPHTHRYRHLLVRACCALRGADARTLALSLALAISVAGEAGRRARTLHRLARPPLGCPTPATSHVVSMFVRCLHAVCLCISARC